MKNKNAKSFVAIMVIIAVSALFLRFGIERIIKVNIAQNESLAQATIKLISTALENYIKDNHGIYPASFSILAQTKPAYLDQDYIARSPVKGYTYSCSRLDSGYSCTASPATCNLSGTMEYTITTGGSLTSEECSKRD